MKFLVRVEQTVEVTLDETKFTPEFMTEFPKSFFPFDTLDEHAEHLAQLHARGVYDMEFPKVFVEGYGPTDAMGITAVTVDVETEIMHPDGYRISTGGDV